MARAFVIRPFGTKKDSGGREIDFGQIHDALIQPALDATALGGGTTEEVIDAGNIREDMFELILEADLVVADITIHNANVFYELGIRHALRKKHTVLIKGMPDNDKTPFDLLTDRYLAYELDNPAASRDQLADMLDSSLRSERETDSPVFGLLPTLPEADPSTVRVLPRTFREEVGRARTARSRGWLALLSAEVRNERFEWDGLELVAEAQWKLKDYDGARSSWEAIRDTHPSDINANLALANVYERLYRENEQPALLEASDQAIRRVLESQETARAMQAEALALAGRNQKTRWRLEFQGAETVEQRREAALNRSLIDSYGAYRRAYGRDLNAFYPGLAALQMGTILEELTEVDGWQDAFDTDDKAEAYRRDLVRQLAALRVSVPAAVEAALENMPENDPARGWAEISAADVLFLTSDRERRVIGAYTKAIPLHDLFAWDSVRGQLELFADLGVGAEIASAVIAAIDKRMASVEKPRQTQKKPVHLVIMGGHTIDARDRPEPRFPQTKEGEARRLLREQLEKVQDEEHDILVLASAAPGADILAHEICQDLGLESIICLPMPREDFAAETFKALDDWKSRFLALLRVEDAQVLELSDRPGLPQWMTTGGADPWERGNRWVMQVARTWGATRVSLIALWDEKHEDATGGTAQMVKLARDAGTIDVKVVDSKQLLG